MKKIQLILSVALFFGILSCNSEEKVEKKTEELPLIETVNGVYTEYYPGRKVVKITGNVDQDSLRNGKWSFFSEQGKELSTTFFVHGLKEGHSIVKYPNGAIHYFGEYHLDKKVGVWKTFDPNGKESNVEDFGTN